MPWVIHYLSEGVDHFLLLENNDQPHASESCELATYIHAGAVTLVKDHTPHVQRRVFQNAQSFFMRSQWVINCDLDEYMYARMEGTQPSQTILEYLSKVPDSIASIISPFKMFHTESLAQSAYPLMVQDQRELPEGRWQQVKWIGRGADIGAFEVHRFTPRQRGTRECIAASPDFVCLESREGTPLRQDIVNLTEPVLSSFSVHLNHYRPISQEFFSISKMVRGDSFGVLNKVRDWKFFTQQNTYAACIADSELKAKV
jgi:Glycosyltransferase family 92